MRERPSSLRGRAIGVVGLGLIGGSALKRLAAVHEGEVRGFDVRRTLARPVSRVAGWSADLETLVRDSDILLLCVPVPAIVGMLPAIAAAAAARTRRNRLIVADVGTLKLPVAAAAARVAAAFDYVGLHPLAGGEINGWRASDAALFVGRTMIYCPAAARLERVARGLIAALGGTAVKMAAETHDRMAAETIGLPHLLAFAAAALRPPARAPHPLRGTSWAGLTRVSVSDPVFVAGLLHDNAIAQRKVLRAFRARLDALAALLDRGDPAALANALRRAATGAASRPRR